MPEAAVHEYHDFATGHNQIGSPRQIPSVEPVSQTECMSSSPDNQFRLRVLLTDAAHVFASLSSADLIHASPE